MYVFYVMFSIPTNESYELRVDTGWALCLCQKLSLLVLFTTEVTE